MTKTTIERIAVLETKVDDINTKIDRNFAESQQYHYDIISRLDKLDDRYPTRREFKAANWVFGIIVTLISLGIAIYAKTQ